MPATTLQRELRGVGLCVVGVLVALALLPRDGHHINLVGSCGHAIAGVLTTAFGFGAWLLPWFFLDAGRCRLIPNRRRTGNVLACLSLALTCAALHLAHDAGGRLGAAVGGLLLTLLGIGAYVVVGGAVMMLLSRYTTFSPVRGFVRLLWRGRRRIAAIWRAATEREIEEHGEAQAARWVNSSSNGVGVNDVVEPLGAPPVDRPASVVHSANVAGAERASVEDVATQSVEHQPVTPLQGPLDAAPATALRVPAIPPSSGKVSPLGPYRLPRIDLLEDPPLRACVVDERKVKATALRLQEKLGEHGVHGKVVVMKPGPLVTMYEFAPEGPATVSKITKLADDLTLALQQQVRIVSWIRGTGHIGIEVPHDEEHRRTVYLRELIEDERWREPNATLPMALGTSFDGQPVYGDLSKMPHLLVAGATGAGKSVGLNAMLASLLMKKSPDELRLLLIDPKVVELAGFDGIPHLLLPVVTEMSHAARALQWAVDEMERRYQLLGEASARNLATYNQRIGAGGQLPSIVVVVDEFADLMMVKGSARQVEAAVARLAQKARAAGIHLIVATQRPSVDVITGMIKANFPSRIAYKVAQQQDSQTILGCSGAEDLLGRGDMLCRLAGSSELQRIHSAYVSDDEVTVLCDYLRSQGTPVYDDSILAARADSDDAESDDPLYDRAVASVAAARSCTVSGLQRALSIGYNRAAKLVERMESEGVVGPASARAGGRREVLVEPR
jgi:S-DNA-T family DNA segregation ATPase FtsK/SpoIIIE